MGLLVGILFSSGCSKDYVVKINGEKISSSDIDKKIAVFKLQNPTMDYSKLSASQAAELRTTVLDNYVAEYLALDDAVDKKGLTVGDQEMTTQAKPYTDTYGSADGVKAAGKKLGLSQADVEEMFFDMAMITAYKDSFVTSRKVDKKILEKYYDTHKSEFVTDDEIEASHILVKTETEANAIYGQLIKGADFAKIAQAKSTDAGSAKSGGDLGWSSPDSYVPEFQAALESLKNGEISKPVKTQYGWHVIKKINTKMGHQMTLDETINEPTDDGTKRTQLYTAWWDSTADTLYAGRVKQLIEKADIEWASSDDGVAFSGAMKNRLETTSSATGN